MRAVRTRAALLIVGAALLGPLGLQVATASAAGCDLPAPPATPQRPLVSPLPMALTNSFGYNHTVPNQESVWVACTGTEWREYVVTIGPSSIGNVPFITSRALPNGAWSAPVNLGPALGITSAANDVSDDLHNSFVVWTDSAGYVHVMGDLHSGTLATPGRTRYVRSVAPHNLSAWEDVASTVIKDDEVDKAYNDLGITLPRERQKTPQESYNVTYPQIVKSQGDNMYLFLRIGSSLAGDLFMFKYDTANRKWGKPTIVISRSNRSPVGSTRAAGFCPGRTGFPKAQLDSNGIDQATYAGIETADSYTPYMHRIDVESGSRAGDSAGRIHLAWEWRKYMEDANRRCVLGTDTLPLFHHQDLSYANFNVNDGKWRNAAGTVLQLPIGRDGAQRDTARAVAGPSQPAARVAASCTAEQYQTYVNNAYGLANVGGLVKTRSSDGKDRIWMTALATTNSAGSMGNQPACPATGVERTPLQVTAVLGIGQGVWSRTKLTHDGDRNPATAQTPIQTSSRSGLFSTKWEGSGSTASTRPLMTYVDNETGWLMLRELSGAKREAPLSKFPTEKTEPMSSLQVSRQTNELHLLHTPSIDSSKIKKVCDAPPAECVPIADGANDRLDVNFERQQGSILSLRLDTASLDALFSGVTTAPSVFVWATSQQVVPVGGSASFAPTWDLQDMLDEGGRPLLRMTTRSLAPLNGELTVRLKAVTSTGEVDLGAARIGSLRSVYKTTWLPLKEKLGAGAGRVTGLRVTVTSVTGLTTGTVEVTTDAGSLS